MTTKPASADSHIPLIGGLSERAATPPVRAPGGSRAPFDINAELEYDAGEERKREAPVDPVGGLVQAAVTARSLDEVLDLIHLLEESPGGEDAAKQAVRAAAVERPVDDVAELVARLSAPPRPPDMADEAIRAAAAWRSVDDVSLLVALLHRAPHAPHAAEEAVRAAATGLPVEALVELIARLEDERTMGEAVRSPVSWPLAVESETLFGDAPFGEEPEGVSSAEERPADGRPFPDDFPAGYEEAAAGAPPARPRVGRTPRSAAPQRQVRASEAPARSAAGQGAQGRAFPPLWLRWVAAVALVICGAAHFPLHREDAAAYGLSIGISALCLILAAGMLLRKVLPVLIANVLFLGALAAGHLMSAKAPSTALARALETGGVFGALAAMLAALVSLLALSGFLTRERASSGGQGRAAPESRNRPTSRERI